jgi:hypothetical protein
MLDSGARFAQEAVESIQLIPKQYLAGELMEVLIHFAESTAFKLEMRVLNH